MIKKYFLLLLCAANLALTACNGGNNQGCLSGVFSVSETKQVRFSRGNLQYTRSTGTWSFAEHQYDFLGTDNVTGGTVSFDSKYGYEKVGSALADKIDLFGWSGSTAVFQFGVGTSTSYSDYSGDFVDWGQNIDNGNTWRTVTYDEWCYLFFTRENARSLRGFAKINLGVEKYANGLVLLPDNWQAPKDVAFKSGFSDTCSVAAYGEYQTFTTAEWQVLESAGAVFLPASGRCYGTDVRNVGYGGIYWSATPYYEDYAWSLLFYSDGAGKDAYSRNYGQSVRLVQDVK